MKIALVSFNSKWEDKDSNFEDLELNLKLIEGFKCDFVVFPEMTLTGFSMDSKKNAESIESSISIGKFKLLSKKYNISIIAGIVLEDQGKYFNCCMVTDKKGDLIAIYKKIHPFSFSGENLYYSAGEELVALKVFGGIGLTICYDLRFSELYNALSVDNSIIINIASWPSQRSDHWQTLLKARSIENQCYIVGVNRSGVDGNKLVYDGNSLVFSPNGTLVNPITILDDIQIYEFDEKESEISRDQFPVLNDKRKSLYRRWY